MLKDYEWKTNDMFHLTVEFTIKDNKLSYTESDVFLNNFDQLLLKCKELENKCWNRNIGWLNSVFYYKLKGFSTRFKTNLSNLSFQEKIQDWIRKSLPFGENIICDGDFTDELDENFFKVLKLVCKTTNDLTRMLYCSRLRDKRHVIDVQNDVYYLYDYINSNQSSILYDDNIEYFGENLVDQNKWLIKANSSDSFKLLAIKNYMKDYLLQIDSFDGDSMQGYYRSILRSVDENVNPFEPIVFPAFEDQTQITNEILELESEFFKRVRKFISEVMTTFSSRHEFMEGLKEYFKDLTD